MKLLTTLQEGVNLMDDVDVQWKNDQDIDWYEVAAELANTVIEAYELAIQTLNTGVADVDELVFIDDRSKKFALRVLPHTDLPANPWDDFGAVFDEYDEEDFVEYNDPTTILEGLPEEEEVAPLTVMDLVNNPKLTTVLVEGVIDDSPLATATLKTILRDTFRTIPGLREDIVATGMFTDEQITEILAN
jgi:hypothetical protein